MIELLTLIASIKRSGMDKSRQACAGLKSRTERSNEINTRTNPADICLLPFGSICELNGKASHTCPTIR